MKKNLFLRLCLMFGIIPIFLLVLFSCTSELLQTGQENSQNTSRNLVRQLRYSDFSKEAPSIVSKIAKKGLVRSQTKEQSKTFTVNDFSIEGDYVFISEHEDGKKTYTFWSQPNENSSWYLENYVLNEQDNGILDAYIIRYDSLMVTHQDQILVDDIKNHMELEYQGQLSDNSTTQRALYCPKVPFQEYVWVPGATCTSPEYHHEYGEPCNCDNSPGGCDRAEPGFYIIQMVMLPTDCGGGGASPGGGITPGSSPISTGPYNPIGSGGVPILVDPCKKITKSTENSFFKSDITYLEGKTNADHEEGYRLDDALPNSGQTGVQNQLLQGVPGTKNISFTVSGGTFAVIHSHFDSLYPIFSPDDLIFFNQWIAGAIAWNIDPSHTPKIPVNDLTLTVVTSNENYLLTFDSSSTNAFPSYTPDQIEDLNKKYKEKLDKAKTNGILDVQKLEQEFLNFMSENMNMTGLRLYKVKSDGNYEIDTLNPLGVKCP